MPGYHGKIANTKYFSEKHRTSVAHFLNDGKWDSLEVERSFRAQVVDTVYHESRKSGQPVFCIVDDTIASHTASSSQALHPIEAAYYHMSHLKKQHDYGHQAVGVMLSCNGLSLNYAMVLYDKSRSKIEIVRRIAQELPAPPNAAYFLCDSWYTSNELMEAFAQKGFETIGALRTNRIIYPNQSRQQAKAFAPSIRKDDPNVSLVTVGHRRFYAYRYDGKVSDCENAVFCCAIRKSPLGIPMHCECSSRRRRIFPREKSSKCTQSAGVSRCFSETASRNLPLTSASFGNSGASSGCGGCAFPLLHSPGLQRRF